MQKVVRPKEGEEFYVYLAVLLVCSVVYYVHSLLQQVPVGEQITLGDVVARSSDAAEAED